MRNKEEAECGGRRARPQGGSFSFSCSTRCVVLTPKRRKMFVSNVLACFHICSPFNATGFIDVLYTRGVQHSGQTELQLSNRVFVSQPRALYPHGRAMRKSKMASLDLSTFLLRTRQTLTCARGAFRRPARRERDVSGILHSDISALP